MPDYYDDGAPPDQTSMRGEGESPEKQEETQDNQKTALIPESLCPGMDVGDEVILKIVGVHEDEYEVAYAPEKGKDEKEPSMSKASEDNESSMHGGPMRRYMED